MTKILVTGCSTCLAHACIPIFLEDPRIERVTGIDYKGSIISHPKYHEHVIDIRSPELEKHLANVDAIVHMSFVTNSGELGPRRNDREYIHSINVEGGQQVFQLAAAFNIETVIHLSSAIVYGLSPDNPSFIEETHPLMAMNGFYYSEDKVALESFLDEFISPNNGPRIVRLRPHIVLGEYAQPLIKAVLRQPFHFMFPDPQPLTQAISEVDVANAILQSLFSDVSGSFNLATDQVSSFHWLHKHLHRYSLPLPLGIGRQLDKLAWRFTPRFGDPAWFECMKYPLTVSNEKARQMLNWAPTLNLFECLEATV